MAWPEVALHGAGSISRVVGVYDVWDSRRTPFGHYKIKVLQRGPADFAAFPNLGVKAAGGVPEWTSGLGGTEAAALEDALAAQGALLDTLGGERDAERFAWTDPTEF